MQRIYRSILEHISKVYEKHEAKAISMNQKRNKEKDGNQGPNKDQTRFFATCSKSIQNLVILRDRMNKSKELSKNGEMKNYVNMVSQTIEFMEQVNKRKVLTLKANKPIIRLSEGTNSLIPKMITGLDNMEKGSGICCGGQDGQKVFRNMMVEFRQHVSNWRFLAQVEPKEMSQSYIAEPFIEAEFGIIKDILSRNWPQGNKVIERQKIVEVKVPYQVIREVDRSKPNRLSLANELIYGINRQMHPTLGIEIYMEEADRNNNSDACNMLGQIYELGQLLPKDPQKAMTYYKKSNDSRNPYGTYLYGRGFQRGLLRQEGKPSKEDFIMALKLYSTSAQDNCSDACIELADIYERGHFDTPNEMATVQKDLAKAYNYYIKARDLGSPKALNNLGVMYLKNKTMDQNNPNSIVNNDANIQKNQRTAVTYFEEAVATGFPMAFFNLGNLYEKGEIVGKNNEKAMELYYDGAEKGCNKSKIAYAYHLINKTSIYKENFEDEYRGGIKWLEEVVSGSERQEDIAKAFYYLGVYYEYGFGVDKKPKKAVEYFQKSAYLQHSCAMNKLGNCYYSGFGVQSDRKIAIGYYKQAAEQGNDEALINLGTAYFQGVPGILEKNYHIAYDYFERAMKAGNTDAYVHLSQMYEKGIVVQKDDNLANELLVMGAYKNNQTAIYMLNQRGQTIDAEMIAKFQKDFFEQPKQSGHVEAIPYIRDLSKAMSSRVSRIR